MNGSTSCWGPPNLLLQISNKGQSPDSRVCARADPAMNTWTAMTVNPRPARKPTRSTGPLAWRRTVAVLQRALPSQDQSRSRRMFAQCSAASSSSSSSAWTTAPARRPAKARWCSGPPAAAASWPRARLTASRVGSTTWQQFPRDHAGARRAVSDGQSVGHGRMVTVAPPPFSSPWQTGKSGTCKATRVAQLNQRARLAHQYSLAHVVSPCGVISLIPWTRAVQLHCIYRKSRGR